MSFRVATQQSQSLLCIVGVVLEALLLSGALVAQQSSLADTPATSSTAIRTPNAELQQEDDVLEDGTPVKLRLMRSFSSATAKAGDEIPFEVLDEIDVDGVTIVNKGAKAIGVFTDAEPGRSRSREGKLSFRLSYVELVDGYKAPLRATTGRATGHSNVNKYYYPTYPRGAVDVGVDAAVLELLTLLLKGTDASIPAGTKLTAFVNGDVHLDLSHLSTTAKSLPEQAPSQMTPVLASLRIDSAPAGADVLVDGAHVCSTPCSVSVTLTSHRIVLTKDGFAEWTKTLHVTDNTMHVNAVLEVSSK